MNPLWKKRLKKMAKDGENYGMYVLCTVLIGGFLSLFTGLIFSGILNFALFPTVSWTVGVVGVALAVGVTLEQLYSKKSPYDEKIKDEERKKSLEEQRKKEEEIKRIKTEKEQYRMAFLQVINQMEMEEEEKVIIHKAFHITQQIDKIVQTYPLKKEEEYYLCKTLPNDLMESIVLYRKLNKKNQEEMKASIHQLLDKKVQEIEERFILKYESDMKQQLEQRIRLAESRDY